MLITTTSRLHAGLLLGSGQLITVNKKRIGVHVQTKYTVAIDERKARLIQRRFDQVDAILAEGERAEMMRQLKLKVGKRGR